MAIQRIRASIFGNFIADAHYEQFCTKCATFINKIYTFSNFLNNIHKMDSMLDMNRTTSVPKSVLCYELDKDSTLNWKLPLTNVVPQIKKLMVDES